MLFQIMWATGVTPTAWKESTTVLLFKHKGSIKNLRTTEQLDWKTQSTIMDMHGDNSHDRLQ
jgi:hypothetical protein